MEQYAWALYQIPGTLLCSEEIAVQGIYCAMLSLTLLLEDLRFPAASCRDSQALRHAASVVSRFHFLPIIHCTGQDLCSSESDEPTLSQHLTVMGM